MALSQQLIANLEFSLADRCYKLACKSGLSFFSQLTRRLVQKAAQKGHPPTLLVFGQRLMNEGVTTRDRLLGAEYLMKAAQQGDAEAQWSLACFYERGCAPFLQNDAHAVTWYARAAEQGQAEARARLAQAYRAGELGLAKSEEKASLWEIQG
ncbi:sel1 repeat family protein [Marinospirillum sp. MEB164]|uniref:Sel1 repeat family protein n=1 Tax=Marinospirillum alkalitolerans TaxID=3123374 RepID=A0ABW8PSZ5_9GAMM